MHRRKQHVRSTLTGLCCLVGLMRPALAVQPQLAVITARSAPNLTLDRNTLRNIYLKKIFVDQDRVKLNPVNLPKDSLLRNAFVQSIIHVPDAQLQDYWDREYFQGVSPPYVLGSQDAVVRFVATTPGAIGYVALCHVDATVHVALVIVLPLRAVDDISDCQAHPAP